MTDLSYQAEPVTYGRVVLSAPTSIPNRQLVQFPIGLYEKRTSSIRPELTDPVMEDLEEELAGRGLTPTPPQLTSLRSVVATLSEMATGTCPPRLMVSDLAPGMGKTTALTLFLRHLTRSEDFVDVGVLVCLRLRDEIVRLVEDAQLAKEDYAVMWSDTDRPLPSSVQPDQAQVLFITQKMLESRCGNGPLAQCRDFHYLGAVRQVRVWDETIDPGEVMTLSTDQLGGLLEPVRSSRPELADLIAEVQAMLADADPGEVLAIPEIPRSMRVARSSVPQIKQQHLATLYHLSGATVRVCDGAGKLHVALNTRDALPRDFAPALVLDASAAVRGTYQLWSQRPDGPICLPSASKDYRPMTVHILQKGAGKQSWRQNGDEIAREVAEIIDSKPDEDFLVIHHMAQGDVDPARSIKQCMVTDTDRVSFLHWGRHMATNAYRTVPNVILAGVLRLPASQHIGLAYASLGKPIKEPLSPNAVKVIELGEMAHAVLQAAGRGAVRGCQDGQCPPFDLYIITPRQQAVTEMRSIFPGATVKRRRLQTKRPKGQALQLIKALDARMATASEEPIYFADLMAELGIKDRSNFNKLCRRPEVADTLTKLNLQRTQIHSTRGDDAFQRVFGPIA